MTPNTRTGPGRAQRKGRSAGGRTTAKGGGSQRSRRTVGRYTSPVESGKYTPPIPKTVRESPRWYGGLVIGLMVLGLVTIILNYSGALPWGTNPSDLDWGLIAALGMIAVGFFLATRLR